MGSSIMFGTMAVSVKAETQNIFSIENYLPTVNIEKVHHGWNQSDINIMSNQLAVSVTTILPVPDKISQQYRSRLSYRSVQE